MGSSILKEVTQKLYAPLLLTVKWPELNHMPTPSCKGVWEMFFFLVVSSSLSSLKSRVCITKRQKGRRNGYWELISSSICHRSFWIEPTVTRLLYVNNMPQTSRGIVTTLSGIDLHSLRENTWCALCLQGLSQSWTLCSTNREKPAVGAKGASSVSCPPLSPQLSSWRGFLLLVSSFMCSFVIKLLWPWVNQAFILISECDQGYSYSSRWQEPDSGFTFSHRGQSASSLGHFTSEGNLQGRVLCSH